MKKDSVLMKYKYEKIIINLAEGLESVIFRILCYMALIKFIWFTISFF